MSRFSKPEAADAASGEAIVCLTADDDKKTCLYAHPVTLRSWSGTLRNVLEDISGTDTTTCTSTDGSSSYQLINIPVEASEMAAWEAALDIMHPPLAAARTSSPIHPYNAMELLQLADKYDMPGVKHRVRQHVMLRGATQKDTPLLTTWLTAQNAYQWLEAAGRYGLEDVAQVCIDHIIKHRLAPATKQIVLQPQHTADLVSGLMKALPAAREPAITQFRTSEALVPARLVWDSEAGSAVVICAKCGVQWYVDSRYTRLSRCCTHCGHSGYKLRGH